MKLQNSLPENAMLHSANERVLNYLKQNAEPKTEEGWYVQHAHPDLEERLYLTASGLSSKCKKSVYGYPVLVNPTGIIFGVAMGMTFLAYRIPLSIKESALEFGGEISLELDERFICFDPWNINVPTKQWIGDLQYWCEQAYLS